MLVGIQLCNWCTESLIISGFFSNCAPYPSFKAHFCGHPQFRSTPSQYLIKINVKTYNLNIYVYMYVSYGIINLEAFIKSDELFAPNWTISGLSSMYKRKKCITLI